MFWNRNHRETETSDETLVLRGLLEIAAAGPREYDAPSPHVAARMRSRAVEELDLERSTNPIGRAALQMLPALVLLVLVLGAWTGYETVRTSALRRAAVAEALIDETRLDEMILAAVFLGAIDPARGNR